MGLRWQPHIHRLKNSAEDYCSLKPAFKLCNKGSKVLPRVFYVSFFLFCLQRLLLFWCILYWWSHLCFLFVSSFSTTLSSLSYFGPLSSSASSFTNVFLLSFPPSYLPIFYCLMFWFNFFLSYQMFILLRSQLTFQNILFSSLISFLHLTVPCSQDPTAMSSPSGVDHAVIGGVVAVIVFILLCLLIIFGRYLIRHKGQLLARAHTITHTCIHEHSLKYTHISTGTVTLGPTVWAAHIHFQMHNSTL